MSDGRLQFQLGFEVSPIILTGGIAAEIPGAMLPIIALTESSSFNDGLLQGAEDIDPDKYFARFKPIPGGTLVNNQIGSYPFANQAVAANAIIAQPLNVSLEMICPVREIGGYQAKLSVLSALKEALDNHTSLGGTYTIATPSYIYTDCILTNLRDITGGDSKQAQVHWQWDFTKPLVSLQDAELANNALMGKISNGLPIDGEPSWSGTEPSVGSPVSGATSSVIPSSSQLIAVNSGNSSNSQSVDYLSGGIA